ncbi:MAG: HAD hydrolase family protein [Gammaproteobacteria bacterium]|nr:HAD hydrolase family protein [Gammaproteobacteria bacterium]MCI0590164.1 HAD hydrolase family protein [Gammaproteobacteria bacterium]
MRKPRSHPAGNESLDSLVRLVQRVRLIAFDFDGVFTDNTVYVFEDGREAVRCHRSDGIGLSKLKRLGVDVVIVSTEANPVVMARSRKLGIECFQNANDKRGALAALLEKRGLSFQDVAFVGNDLNDLGCLQEVLLPIVVNNAHPDVLRYAKFRTEAPGGAGAVREVCDLFERLRTPASRQVSS